MRAQIWRGSPCRGAGRVSCAVRTGPGAPARSSGCRSRGLRAGGGCGEPGGSQVLHRCQAVLCPSAASCAPGQRSHSPVEYPRPIGDFYVKLCSWASGELALDPWEPVRLLLTVGGGLRGRGRPWGRGRGRSAPQSRFQEEGQTGACSTRGTRVGVSLVSGCVLFDYLAVTMADN